MLWRKRSQWNENAVNHPDAVKFGISAIKGYGKLVLLPNDPVSQEFQKKISGVAKEVEEYDSSNYDQLANYLDQSVTEFANKQSVAIERSLDTVYGSLQQILKSLEGAINSGDSLEFTTSSSSKRLLNLKSVKNYNEIIDGIQKEVEVLHHAVSRHKEETKLVQTICASQVESLRGKLKEAEKAVRTDHLTKLPNRAAFDFQLQAALTKVSSRENYALAIIDLNGFKQINDQYGHLAGDAALTEFALKLKETFSGIGTTIFRIAGDEFAVIYKGSEVQLEAKLERITSNFQKRPFVHEGKTIQISHASGVIVLKAHHTVETAFREADLAMYKLKQSLTMPRQRAA
jgi:diguanylate cyclase (GGDEF)-like protein